MPQRTPNTGTEKVTLEEIVGPSKFSSLKYIRYAKPVQKKPKIITDTQLTELALFTSLMSIIKKGSITKLAKDKLKKEILMFEDLEKYFTVKTPESA